MLSGHLCRCTGYEPIVDAIAAGGGGAVNLALSLLAAAERTRRRRRFPGITYAELRERARRDRGRARRSSAASGSPPCSTTASRRRCSTGRRQWAGAVFVPLSWRASEADLDYCVEDCGAAS